MQPGETVRHYAEEFAHGESVIIFLLQHFVDQLLDEVNLTFFGFEKAELLYIIAHFFEQLFIALRLLEVTVYCSRLFLHLK